MCLNVSLVIVPNWVESAMLAGHVRAGRVVDLYALSSILSRRDISFYAACNILLWDRLPKALRETFRPHDLIDHSGRSTTDDDQGSRPEPAVVKRFMDDVFTGTWDGAMFRVKHPDAADVMSAFPYSDDSAEPIDASMLLFDVFYITETTYGVRLYPRDPKLSYVEQLNGCYDRLLELLNGHIPFETMASTTVFQEFVKLSRQRTTV